MGCVIKYNEGMRSWSKIKQETDIDVVLFNLIRRSVIDLKQKVDPIELTGFSLYCNIKYAQIFLSAESKEHLSRTSSQIGSSQVLESSKWSYYQFNTDVEGIRDYWRNDWGDIQNVLSDDIFMEYLDLATTNRSLADRIIEEIEKEFKKTVIQTYNACINLKEFSGLSHTQIEFVEEYYM